MPKSKRNKVVNLTKTKSRGRARKSDLIKSVQKCCDDYKCIYVFSCDNMRSDPIKRLRNAMKEDRFIFGKNKVVKLAMGKTIEEAYIPGIEKLVRYLVGDVGILFTNQKPSKIEKIFSEFSELDFARAGFAAMETVTLVEGPIEGQPSSMYEPLRKMLLPVKLNKGVVELECDHVLCAKGDVLTTEQAQALKFFGYKLAKFSALLRYRFRDGHVTKLTDEADPEEDMEESDE